MDKIKTYKVAIRHDDTISVGTLQSRKSPKELMNTIQTADCLDNNFFYPTCTGWVTDIIEVETK